MRMFDKITVARICIVTSLVVTGLSLAQQNVADEERDRRNREMLAAPNPLEASDSLWIDQLTYMEVRDRIRNGYNIAIIPTGGVEQNGPFLITGKHNVMLEMLCPAIAADLGHAICAPIVPFVPEGNIDPPTGHMIFPGSISVRDATFHALIDDIASSLKQSGFTEIILIGDSGGNQRGLAAVAQDLNKRWAGTPVSAHFVREFYDPGWAETLKYAKAELGIRETRNDGHHDDIFVTAVMMSADPETVRYEQRIAANLAVINGVKIAPKADTIALGDKLIQYRAKFTANAIRNAIGAK